MSDPKARITAAAMACFAAKGYAATTMSDIEAAAGFVPRTGGTYRHFRSKRAILEAALAEQLAANDHVLDPEPTTAVDAANAALEHLDRQRDLMRVLFRDLDQFPDLLADVSEQLIHRTYRRVAERIALVAPGADTEAMAVLLLGALVNYKIIETMTGRPPGDVPAERVAAAWGQLFELLALQGAR